MDPKMDSGLHLKGVQHYKDFNPCVEVTSNQVLGILDRVLATEVLSFINIR